MGSVKKYLYKSKLPDREIHNSRLFVDLAENIHIHHREYRTVFSLDEYFEYVDIILKSTEDVRNFLEQNPDYEEKKFPTTIMIAGGKERQLKFLKNSPKPNKSAYYDNDFAIELQDEFVTDEIHIHYRDFRIALDRTRFKEMAKGFKEALEELEKFEAENKYEREFHPDRGISDFNNLNDDIDTKQMGIKKITLNKIKSHWYKNMSDFKANKQFIEELKKDYKKYQRFVPIILAKEKNEYVIVDGHHRVYTALELGLKEIEAVVLDMPFDKTEKIRQAEVLLKQFDEESGYKYGVSNYFKSFLGYKFNRYYNGLFRKKLMTNSWWYNILRKIKRMIFGKKYVFKTFNEAHNKHK